VEELTNLVEECLSSTISDRADCYKNLEIKITEAVNLDVSDDTLSKPREVLNEYEQTKYSKKIFTPNNITLVDFSVRINLLDQFKF